jgi:uncharacterized repeat protein (TIGR01451 family)
VQLGWGETVTCTFTNERRTGAITLVKVMQGDPSGASTAFSVKLDCDGATYDQSVALNEGNHWSKTIGDVPSGLTCTVTEPTVPAGWKLEEIKPSGAFTVGDEETVMVKVTNQRLMGKIKVRKVLVGDAIGTSTDFTVRVDCPGSAYDQDILLTEANGWVNTSSWIPSGTVCTLTEVKVPDGWNPEGFGPGDDSMPSVDVTVGTGTPETASAVVTNKRRTGKLTVTKVMEGDPAGAGTEFTVKVDCQGHDYDYTVVLSEANSWTWTKAGIPSGIDCTVSEPSVPAGWERVSIEPATVTIDSYDTVAVTVTNRRLEGGVTVHKLIDGDVAGASTDFTVLLNCDVDAYDTSAQLTSQNGWSATFSKIPSGVTCMVMEPTVPVGWQLKSISPSGSFTVGAGQNVVVDVTNQRQVGSLTVSKVVEGDVAGASTDFSVAIDCDGTAYDRTVALNKANNWTATVTDIPSGVSCTVTEPAVPAGWKLKAVEPAGAVTLAADKDVAVKVTNTRTTGVITVTKVLDGAPNGASTDFTFDVDCPGTAYDQTLMVKVPQGTNASATTSAIPTGLSCTVTERATPDWRQTAVVPANGVVAVGSTVTFTNQRLQGTLKISKTVSPVAGNGVVVEFGSTLTYTLTVSATGEQRQPNVVVTDYVPGTDPERAKSGKTTYVKGSATCIGAGTCEVTGPDSNGLITWKLGEMAAGTTRQVTFQVTIDDVTGAAGETVAVDILNAGAVQSERTPRTPSNEVVTPVSKVLPVKIPNEQPKPLPHTGAALPVGPTAGAAVLLFGLGLLLVAAGRRRSGATRR